MCDAYTLVAFKCRMSKDVVVAGCLRSPVFSVCCKSLLACHACWEDWHVQNDTCPKCRQANSHQLGHVVAGLDKALRALASAIEF